MSSSSLTPDSRVIAQRDWSDELGCACRIYDEGRADARPVRFANDNECGVARLPNRTGARLLSFLADPREGVV